MPIFEAGIAQALNDNQRRAQSQAEVQRLLALIAQAKWNQDMEEQDRARTFKARGTAADTLANFKDFQNQEGPQAPPPGAPSMPAGPPAGAQPQGAPPPMMGGPPGGAPQPFLTGQGPPQAPPVDGWKAMPGGMPPGAPAKDPGAPPEPDAVISRKMVSTSDIAKYLASKGIKGEDAFDVLEAMKPMMDDDNKTQLHQMQNENTLMRDTMHFYETRQRQLETEHEHAKLDTDRTARTEQMQERTEISRQRMHNALAKAAGGQSNLDKAGWKDIYPNGPDGRPDTSAEPIGAEARTKSGVRLVVDNHGTLQSDGSIKGGTAAQAKAAQAKEKQRTAEEDKELAAEQRRYGILVSNLTKTPEEQAEQKRISASIRAKLSKTDVATMRKQAQAAIKEGGKDPEGTKKAFKDLTGEDLGNG